MPSAEFLISVGNSSAVCNVTIEYTALIPKRPAIARNTTQYVLPANKQQCLVNSFNVEISFEMCILLGTAKRLSRKNPDNANSPHEDTFLPKNRSKIMDNT